MDYIKESQEFSEIVMQIKKEDEEKGAVSIPENDSNYQIDLSDVEKSPNGLSIPNKRLNVNLIRQRRK